MNTGLKVLLIGTGGYLAYDLYRLKQFSDQVTIKPTKDIKIGKGVSFKGLIIEAKVTVSNATSKEIPLTKISGRVLSGGRVFATLHSVQSVILKPKSSVDITLKFDAKTKDILTSIASAISAKKISVDYVATISPKLIGLIPVPFNSSGVIEYDISEYLSKIYEAINQLKQE